MNDVHLPGLDSIEAGAPEDEEFEITPEMIAAGRNAHSGYDPRYDDIEELVWDIWIAMTVASRCQKTD
jgi:hypothetical protein